MFGIAVICATAGTCTVVTIHAVRSLLLVLSRCEKEPKSTQGAVNLFMRCDRPLGHPPLSPLQHGCSGTVEDCPLRGVRETDAWDRSDALIPRTKAPLCKGSCPEGAEGLNDTDFARYESGDADGLMRKAAMHLHFIIHHS